jgi:pimeloyl-ACP methyl ester carboxylesterase
MKSRLFCLILVIVLVACSTPEPAAVPTDTPVPEPATAAPPAEEPVAVGSGQKVSVGEYELYIECVGAGSPTVVFDSGLMVSSAVWDKVVALIGESPQTRVCVYDRLRLGKSATFKVKRTPRTNQDMVDDLHTLLVNAKIAGPYILVAHSMSGFNAHLYASQYPAEVAGMVWIDVCHPDQWDRQMALLPPESADEAPSVRYIRHDVFEEFVSKPLQNGECWDILASAEQVRAAGDLGDIPLVVLTRDVNRLNLEQLGFPPGFDVELVEALARDWLAMQEELAGLSSNSTHILVPDSTHMIPVEYPESIVDAILQVLEEVRSE